MNQPETQSELDIPPVDRRLYPLTWRKARFPWWVRLGLFGAQRRLALVVSFWGIVALTLGSLAVFIVALRSPEGLPFLFRSPSYSGAMVGIGLLGSTHYYLTLRWIDRRELW